MPAWVVERGTTEMRDGEVRERSGGALSLEVREDSICSRTVAGGERALVYMPEEVKEDKVTL